MKKTLSILLASIVCLFSFNTAFAQNTVTNTENESSVYTVATVNIYNAKIVSQNDRNFVLSFELFNRVDVQPQVMYSVFMKSINGTSTEVLGEKIYDDVVSLSEGELIKKEIKYYAPSSLKAGEYEIWISSRNKNSFPFGVAYVGNVTLLNSSNPYVQIVPETCYTTVSGDTKGTRIPLSYSAELSSSSVLTANCVVNNTFATSVTLKTNFVTKKRTIFGEAVQALGGESGDIVLKVGQNKISFVLPKASIPQDYTVLTSLVSSDGLVNSNEVAFQYSVAGVSGSIENVVFDKTSYASGTLAILNIFSTFTNFSSSSKIALTINVFDGKGLACSDAVSKTMTPDKMIFETGIEINKKCTDPKATIKLDVIDANGNIINLDNQNFEVKTVEPKSSSNPFISFIKTYWLLLVLLVVIIIVFSILIIKKKRTVINVSMLVFVLLAVFFSFSNQALADTYHRKVEWQGAWGASNQWDFFYWTYNVDKYRYASGSDITVSASVSSDLNIQRCGNMYDQITFFYTNDDNNYFLNLSSIDNRDDDYSIDELWGDYGGNRQYRMAMNLGISGGIMSNKNVIDWWGDLNIIRSRSSFCFTIKPSASGVYHATSAAPSTKGTYSVSASGVYRVPVPIHSIWSGVSDDFGIDLGSITFAVGDLITASPIRVNKGASTAISWDSMLSRNSCSITANGKPFVTGVSDSVSTIVPDSGAGSRWFKSVKLINGYLYTPLVDYTSSAHYGVGVYKINTSNTSDITYMFDGGFPSNDTNVSTGDIYKVVSGGSHVETTTTISTTTTGWGRVSTTTKTINTTYYDYSVARYTSGGAFVSQVTSTSSVLYPITSSKVAIDSKGNIYVSIYTRDCGDTCNNFSPTYTYRLYAQKFNSSGTPSHLVLVEEASDSYKIAAIAFDNSEKLYIKFEYDGSSTNYVRRVDFATSKVVKIKIDSSSLTNYTNVSDMYIDSTGRIMMYFNSNRGIKNKGIFAFSSANCSFLGCTSDYIDTYSYSPSDVAGDSRGNIYILDEGAFRVQKYNSSGKYVNQYYLNGLEKTRSSRYSTIATDSLGNFYVASDNQIQKLNSNFEFVASTSATIGTERYQSYVIDAISIDSNDVLYVAFGGNQKIRKFSLSGGGFTLIETLPYNRASTIGGIDIDSSGNIWVADYGYNLLQKFDSKGNYLYSFTPGYPAGVAADSPNGAYVSNGASIIKYTIGDKQLKGVKDSGPITEDTTYVITCVGGSGGSDTDSVLVKLRGEEEAKVGIVVAESADEAGASTTSVNSGDSVYLTYSGSGVSSYEVTSDPDIVAISKEKMINNVATVLVSTESEGFPFLRTNQLKISQKTTFTIKGTSLDGETLEETATVYIKLSKPTGLTVSDSSSCGPVTLSWNAVSGADAYHVYRNGSLIGNTSVYDSKPTHFTDNTITDNGTYSYTVTAVVEGESESDPSASASANVSGCELNAGQGGVISATGTCSVSQVKGPSNTAKVYINKASTWEIDTTGLTGNIKTEWGGDNWNATTKPVSGNSITNIYTKVGLKHVYATSTGDNGSVSCTATTTVIQGSGSQTEI